jgi:hypothetical protein
VRGRTYDCDDNGWDHRKHDEGELPRADNHDDQIEQQLNDAAEKHGHRTSGYILKRSCVGTQPAQELARLALVKQPVVNEEKRRKKDEQRPSTCGHCINAAFVHRTSNFKNPVEKLVMPNVPDLLADDAFEEQYPQPSYDPFTRRVENERPQKSKERPCEQHDELPERQINSKIKRNMEGKN